SSPQPELGGLLQPRRVRRPFLAERAALGGGIPARRRDGGLVFGSGSADRRLDPSPAGLGVLLDRGQAGCADLEGRRPRNGDPPEGKGWRRPPPRGGPPRAGSGADPRE